MAKDAAEAQVGYVKKKRKKKNAIEKLRAFDREGLLNAIIDTPRNSRNKYVFGKKKGLFKLSGTLAAGHSFPYDFGFIPNTLGGDGDALDVLILMDEPAFVGCWVKCRVIGGYQAFQTSKVGTEKRNDRFLAVEVGSLVYSTVRSISDLDQTLVDQIEHFFVSYNKAKGKRFEVFERFDAGEAVEHIEAAMTKPRKRPLTETAE